jgi:hypothetical protein
MICPDRKALLDDYTAAVKEYERIVSSLKDKHGQADFDKALAASNKARTECQRRRLLLDRHSQDHTC